VPTYDYRCSSCGERVEIVHPIVGGPPDTCPSCGAFGTLRKAFAPPTIHFKGTGWAKKERHASAAKRRAAAEGATGEAGTSAPSGGTKDESGSDTKKPAAAATGEPGDSGGSSKAETKPKAEPAGR
jgi:putative FmdB family regulatory protein